MMALRPMYDVVVVGGGAAGLSAGLMLARVNRSVLVVDGGAPRNAPAPHVRGLLGHDGISPAALLEQGREEIRRYGGALVDGMVAGVAKSGDGFRVVLADGTATLGRRLLVTTGSTDVLPDIPGVRERWGRDVLHCPYCHGWEVKDAAIGVIYTGELSVKQALLFRQLSSDVVLLDDGARLVATDAETLAARGIDVVSGAVRSVEIQGDRVVGARLADDRMLPRSVLTVVPRVVANASLLRELGLEPVEHPSGSGDHIAVDATGRTAVPGVWAAGNIADPTAQVGTAAAAAATAVTHINADLVAEEAAQALLLHKARSATPAPELTGLAIGMAGPPATPATPG